MFTGDLQQKTFADLEAFLLQGIPEGIRLDYKRDFPGNLEKVIAAMANTEGGVILIGVDEDAERPRYPALPPVGVPVGQAVERVVSKAYQAIRESLVPEVVAIPFPDEPERCVVVVRMQPSERAPHAVGGASDIYVRVDSQAMPTGDLETRMGIERLELLFRRRAENAELLAQAESRCRELLGGVPVPDEAVRIDMTVQPALAHTVPLTIAELGRLAQQPSHTNRTQYPELNCRVVAGGLVSLDGSRQCYVDVMGLAASSLSVLPRSLDNVTPSPERVLLPQWLQPSVVLLHWSARSAVESGRGGTLVARIELSGIRGSALLFAGGGFEVFEADAYRALQDKVHAEIRLTADEMMAEPGDAALLLLARVAEAFGRVVTVSELRRIFGPTSLRAG